LKLQGGQEIIPIKLGNLNPIDEISGVKQRLNNLGFRCGGEDNQWNDQAKSALKEFQSKHKLPESGELDAATKSKLQALHP
jgi:peptidoglycan hydrolase-like protein with peptidoglycan-binding domain